MLNPDELDESLYQPVYGTGYIFRLLKFPFCRFALINLLQALQTDVSSHYAWRLLWKSLSFLRDCRLLPAALVVDTEKDLLPSNIRSEFEEKLLLLEDKNLFGDNSKTMKRSSNSILSLQGLGEAIFGSTADGDNPNVPLDYETEMNNHCRLSARWDQGYEVENMSQNGNANSKYTHDNHVKDLRWVLHIFSYISNMSYFAGDFYQKVPLVKLFPIPD